MLTKEDIPNLLSILRLILIIPIIWMIVENNYILSLILVFIAGVSDGLDGFLARRFAWNSDLGAILDPLADKLMLVSVYIACSVVALVPWWLTFAVVLRDVIIVLGALIYHLKFSEVTIQPSTISKINTFFLIVLALVVILNAIYTIISPDIIEIAFYVTFTTIFLSGADYIWNWSWKAWRLS